MLKTNMAHTCIPIREHNEKIGIRVIFTLIQYNGIFIDTYLCSYAMYKLLSISTNIFFLYYVHLVDVKRGMNPIVIHICVD